MKGSNCPDTTLVMPDRQGVEIAASRIVALDPLADGNMPRLELAEWSVEYG